jgi:hydrogenase nickel incorporation protein HypA/HybF
VHEMSIATALIEQVLEHAEKNNLSHVEDVLIEVGALQLVVPEALEAAFAASSIGTPAADAVLRQEEVAIQARCRSCSHAFHPAIDRYLCPQCGHADAEIIAGRDIILKSLSGPAREELES